MRETVYVALSASPLAGRGGSWGFGFCPRRAPWDVEGSWGSFGNGVCGVGVALHHRRGCPGLPEGYPQGLPSRRSGSGCVVHGVRWSLSRVRSRDRALLTRRTWRRVYGAGGPGEEALRALEVGERAAWGLRYPGVVGPRVQDSGGLPAALAGHPKVLWPHLSEQPVLMERVLSVGGEAWDEGAGPQVPQRREGRCTSFFTWSLRGAVLLPPRKRASCREVGGAEAQGVHAEVKGGAGGRCPLERYAPRTQAHTLFHADSLILGHQWKRVCRLRVSGSPARTRHRSATTSIISSRSRKYRLATASFTKGHTRSTGCSSGL